MQNINFSTSLKEEKQGRFILQVSKMSFLWVYLWLKANSINCIFLLSYSSSLAAHQFRLKELSGGTFLI